MKTQKVIYVISRIDKALAFEWIAQELNKTEFDLSFILLNEGESNFERFCNKNKIECKRLTLRGRKSYAYIILRLWLYFILKRPKVVHAHLIDASLTALPAAWLAFVPIRIYTRHHSTFHHEYYPKAVKWDRLCNRASTDIVAISKNVENVLKQKENVPEKKIHLIYHGFDLDLFSNPKQESINKLKKQYNPTNRSPVVGVISRFTEFKGIQYIIPAFFEYLKQFPKAKLLLFNAEGDYKAKLYKLLANLPNDSYSTINFETDISSSYHLFNMFIHIPIDNRVEAFGQTYIEALAAGIPCIFTLSGIASEFITDHKNAVVVPYKDSHSIYNAMIELTEDKELCAKLIQNGKQDVNQFSLKKMISKLEQLYER